MGLWSSAGLLGVVAVALGVQTTRASVERASVEPDAAFDTDGDAVVLTPPQAARLGLQTVVARAADVKPVLTTTGTVALDPRYLAAVGARIPGHVRRVARFEGDDVNSGELLAEVEGGELGGAEAALLSLRAHESAAERRLAREESLGRRGLSSPRKVELASADFAEYHSMRLAAEQRVTALGGSTGGQSAGVLGVHVLRSPIAGTIVERAVTEGEAVQDHHVAFRVANLDHLWAEVSVQEHSVRSLRAGDAVELCAMTAGAACVSGTVAHIGERVEPTTLTVDVRIEVDNRSRTLRAGQAITAKMHPSGAESAFGTVVPGSAVVRVDGEPTVFVESPTHRITPRRVQLSSGDDKEERVQSGVTPGELVVSAGADALKNVFFH